MAAQTPRDDGTGPESSRSRSRSRRRSGQNNSSIAASAQQRTVRAIPAENLPNGKGPKPPADDKAALIEQTAKQRCKQEQETFDQALSQDKWFFRVRMAMGIVAICAIPAVITICSLIIFDPHQDVVVKRVAESALFFSLIGLMGYVWRVFLNPASVSRLRPVTTLEETSSEISDQKSAARAVNNNTKSRGSNKDDGGWAAAKKLPDFL
jgi:hypothetical protein